MNIIDKIWGFISKDASAPTEVEPRSTSDIISDMNKGAAELRQRAKFDMEQIENNKKLKQEIEAEAARKTSELDAESNKHQLSAEHAERVAGRFDELTS